MAELIVASPVPLSADAAGPRIQTYHPDALTLRYRPYTGYPHPPYRRRGVSGAAR
jgi:hypothetical protein